MSNAVPPHRGTLFRMEMETCSAISRMTSSVTEAWAAVTYTSLLAMSLFRFQLFDKYFRSIRRLLSISTVTVPSCFQERCFGQFLHRESYRYASSNDLLVCVLIGPEVVVARQRDVPICARRGPNGCAAPVSLRVPGPAMRPMARAAVSALCIASAVALALARLERAFSIASVALDDRIKPPTSSTGAATMPPRTAVPPAIPRPPAASEPPPNQANVAFVACHSPRDRRSQFRWMPFRIARPSHRLLGRPTPRPQGRRQDRRQFPPFERISLEF